MQNNSQVGSKVTACSGSLAGPGSKSGLQGSKIKAHGVRINGQLLLVHSFVLAAPV